MEESSPAPSYYAVTSTASRVDPDFLMKTYRSSSQNRIGQPDQSGYGTTSRSTRDRFTRNASFDSSSMATSGSSSLSLDTYVTLRRRKPHFVPSSNNNNSSFSPSHSPMVLSPSATRQFSYCPSSSREGSVTPRFSHSCSNASIVSESADL